MEKGGRVWWSQSSCRWSLGVQACAAYIQDATIFGEQQGRWVVMEGYPRNGVTAGIGDVLRYGGLGGGGNEGGGGLLGWLSTWGGGSSEGRGG